MKQPVARPSPFIARLFVSACLLTLATTAWTLPQQEATPSILDQKQLLSDDMLLRLPKEATISAHDIPHYTWTAGQLLKQGRFAEAVSLCEHLLKMQQDNIEARAHLAAAYKGLGDEEQFKRERENLTRQAPESPAIHLSLAAAYTFLKEFAAVETAYKKGLETTSEQTELRMGLGALYLQQQRLPEASEQYLKVLEQKGLEPKHFLNASFALCRLGLQEKAYDGVIKRAKSLTGLYPPLPQSYQFLASAHLGKGDTKQAITAYESLIKANPQSALPYQELAVIALDRLKDKKRALGYAQEGAKKFPDDAKTQDVLGWVYYQQGNPQEASRQFQTATRLAPDNAQFFYHLGLAQQKLGKKNQASAAYQRALGLTDQARSRAFADELNKRIKATEE